MPLCVAPKQRFKMVQLKRSPRGWEVGIKRQLHVAEHDSKWLRKSNLLTNFERLAIGSKKLPRNGK